MQGGSQEPVVPRVFIQVAVNGGQPRRYQLDKTEIVLGRSPQADVVLDGEQVSRTHAQLTFTNGRWRLNDLNSSNGVFLDRGGRGAPFLARNDLLVSGDHLYIANFQVSLLSVDGDSAAGEEGQAEDSRPESDDEKTVLVRREDTKDGLRAWLQNTPPPSRVPGGGSGA